MDLSVRKSLRLQKYDYSSVGVYFVTICLARRSTLFWDIPGDSVGANCVRPPSFPFLSDAGRLVCTEIEHLDSVYDGVSVDKFCIMPDHIHLLISLSAVATGERPELSRIIKQFKGCVSKRLGRSVWQKSFYDRIMRDEAEYWDTWQYIDRNPEQWEQDWLSRE